MAVSIGRKRTVNCVGMIVMVLLALFSDTAAAQDDQGSAIVSVVAVDFESSNDLGRWLGGPVEGVISVTVANAGADDAFDVTPVVLIGDRVLLVPPIDVASGTTAFTQITASLGGVSLAQRQVTAALGDSRVSTSHRTIPWILVGLIALALNVALVAARDQLRNVVRRQILAARA